MFDADLRYSIHNDRKADRDIRARCGVQLSRFRRGQRAKTGASVEVDDRISLCGLEALRYLVSVGDGNCWQLSYVRLRSDIADHTMKQATICSQRGDRHAGIQMSKWMSGR
jgi:hypothetical protein